MAAAREGKVPFEAWCTWYRIVGDVDRRPPLLCVHGGPGSSHHYFARLEALAERGRAVVLYDQVGCGNSSRPPVDRLDLAVFVDELANLRAQLGLDDIFLLGTSWGGVVAIEYALSRPEGLRGLVLSSTLASAATWATEAARLRDAMPEPQAEVLRTKAPPDPAYEEAQAAFDARHVCRVPDAPEMRRMHAARNPEVYRGVWGANEWTVTGRLEGWDARDRLRDLHVPVLITAGEHDLCTPIVRQELQRALPSASLAVFEGASHMPFLEDPDAYIRVLSAFLEACGTA